MINLKSIITIDCDLSFQDVIVENMNKIEDLDLAISKGKVITIIEKDIKYKLNSIYILFYME